MLGMMEPPNPPDLMEAALDFLRDPAAGPVVAIVVFVAGILWWLLRRITPLRFTTREFNAHKLEPTRGKERRSSNMQVPSNTHEKFFLGEVFHDLTAAKVAADARQVPMFVVIYDEDHPQKSRLAYSLGYFMQYETTKNLVNKNFAQVLVPSHESDVSSLIPHNDPLENSRLVVLTPEGRALRSEGVYANPDEGLKRVREDIEKWNALSQPSRDPNGR